MIDPIDLTPSKPVFFGRGCVPVHNGNKIEAERFVATMTLQNASSHGAPIQRVGVATYGVVAQRVSAPLRDLWIAEPLVVRVHAGEKRVRWPDGERRCVPQGSWTLLPASARVVVENIGDGAEGYRAEVVAFGPVACAAAVHAGGAPDAEHGPVALAGPAVRQATPAFDACVQRIRRSLCDDTLPAAVVRHHVQELLIWADGLPLSRGDAAPGMAGALRALLRKDVSRPWRATEAAARLCVSEATMRRRLAAEGTSFSEVLTDVRLAHGLELLQMTQHPITEIALACGYASPSHFSAAFRARFDLSPSEIRHANLQLDRISIER